MKRTSPRSSRLGLSQRNSGFTLVELLVVVGIIAVLISILLPSLNRAREQAKTALCGSNMRQQHNAFVMYSVENNQWIPAPCAVTWAGPNPNLYKFHPGLYQTGFVYSFFLGKYASYKEIRPGMFDGQAASQSDTRPLSVFQCPSVGPMMQDAPYAVDPSFFQNAYGNGYQALSGYGMNPYIPPKNNLPFLPGFSGVVASDGSQLTWGVLWHLKYTGTGKLGKVRKSARTVLVADGSGVNGMLGDSFEINSETPESNPVVHYATDYRRHNRRTGLNAVYVDGHVDYTDWKTAEPLIRQDRPSDPGGSWRGGNRFCFQEE
jgi:prepilin-type N-terminal cleavage/methylation domain-containing protein/prepilin-type processing-associated H-X9-DG protein